MKKWKKKLQYLTGEIKKKILHKFRRHLRKVMKIFKKMWKKNVLKLSNLKENFKKCGKNSKFETFEETYDIYF